MRAIVTKEVTNQINEGDRVTILKDIKSFTEYGGTNTGSNVARYKGNTCTITYVDRSDNTFLIKEDDKNSWFSPQMTEEYYKTRKLIFDIDAISGNDVCIHCWDKQDVEELFNILREHGIKNGRNEELDTGTFIANNVGEEYYFEVIDGQAFYCNKDYFVQNDYEIYEFPNLLFPMKNSKK